MLVFILSGLLFAGSSADPEPDLARCGGKPYGPHQNETDPHCQGYYLCLGGMRQSLSCAEISDSVGLPMYYDPSRQYCTTNYKCPSLMNEATINEMCSGRGREPQADKDDKSCRTYYVCITNEMRKTIKKFLCEDGTRFDPARHSCTARYNDLCPTLKDINSVDCVNKTKGPHADDKDPYCKSYYYCTAGNYKDTYRCEDSNGIPMFYDTKRMLCSSKYNCENGGSGIPPEELPNQRFPQQQSAIPSYNPQTNLPINSQNYPFPPQRSMPPNNNYSLQPNYSPALFPQHPPVTSNSYNNIRPNSPTSTINQPYQQQHLMTSNSYPNFPTEPTNPPYPQRQPMRPNSYNNPQATISTVHKPSFLAAPINEPYPQQQPITLNRYNDLEQKFSTESINKPYPQQEQQPMKPNNNPEQSYLIKPKPLVDRTFKPTDDYPKHTIDVPNLNPLNHIPVIKLNKATTTTTTSDPSENKQTTNSPLSQDSRIKTILNFDTFGNKNVERTNHPMPDFDKAFNLNL